MLRVANLPSNLRVTEDVWNLECQNGQNKCYFPATLGREYGSKTNPQLACGVYMHGKLDIDSVGRLVVPWLNMDSGVGTLL